MRARYYSVELMRFINEDIVLGDIGNPSSLNRYTYVEGNPATMVDPFGLCGEKIGKYTKSALKNDMIEGGWKEPAISDEYIELLWETLLRYDINTTNRLRMFLAECQYETMSGASFTEWGSDAYMDNKSYGNRYCGAGGIQLTHEYGYQAFAIYMAILEYPELEKYVVYRNPRHNNATKIKEEYDKMIDCANNINIDITKYTQIVTVGSQYVSKEFPWWSAGYYWHTNSLNDYADDPNKGIDAISSVINSGGGEGSFEKRRKNYEMYVSKELFVVD